MHPLNHYARIATVATVALALTGCGSLYTSVKKRNLDVQTKMSATVFLEPVTPARRIIYVEIRNTSDKNLDIKDRITRRLKEAGYRLTNDPDKANFMLQANVLQCGKSDLRTTNNAYNAGWGGAAVGAGAAAVARGSSRSIFAGGLIGATAAVVGEALVDDTLYSMITDVQIRERAANGEEVTQEQDTNARQGTASRMRQHIRGAKTSWKTYRTRIVSTANKANLKFDEAVGPLQDGLVHSISGIF